MTLSTHINGELRQHTTVSEMIFGIDELIAYISHFTHLNPGDLIATGTPEGAGGSFSPTRFLKAGDLVEVSVSGVDQLSRILRRSHTIAVVGLSAEWHRPSFFASKYMQDHGYRIVPVNPRYAKTGTDVLGEHCYADLADIPFAVDMVDVFRRSEDVLPIARQ
eukprot:gene12540-16898_t